MLRKIENLPLAVLGIRAEGKVTGEDYQKVLVPLLQAEKINKHEVRFLYQFGPEFKKITAGAAWEDLRLGMKYLKLFKRCAVVSDIKWIRNTTNMIGGILPCPTKVFHNNELVQATKWLTSSAEKS